ncbi:MAG: methyltransferase [Steroidobacteraceae bacterium]|nr:methyltransferase [Steroidobacteraceae bacterium]
MRSRTKEARLFTSNFLRDTYMVGSIVPSSRFLVNAVLATVDWSRARVVVEYGPGVGTFTAEILRRMRSDATLVVIETNHDFVKFLGNDLFDERLVIEHDSAENVQEILERRGLARADYLVSGVPLGSMPKWMQSAIVTASRNALGPDGEFLVYQFTSRVLPVLRATFQNVRRGFEFRNLPPAQFFVCSDAVRTSP